MDIQSYFYPSSSKSAPTASSDSKRIQVVRGYIQALLRDNVPDQEM